jgi:plastocyanin
MHRSIVISIVLIFACAVSLCTAAAAKKTKHSVTIENMKFNPDKLEITAGDTVEWTNNDERDHNVTAKDGSFKSDNLNSGATYKYTFKKPGKYPYSCTLHPRMKATVIVSPE